MDEFRDGTKEAGDIALLSNRQRQCLALVAQGRSSKEIARALKLSPSTVDNHVQAAIARLAVGGRQEAARLYVAAAQKTPADVPNNDWNRLSLIGLSDARVKPAVTDDPHLQPSLFSLPPLGGRTLNEDKRTRIFRILQIAMLSLMVALALILTVSGIVLLLQHAHWRDAITTRR